MPNHPAHAYPSPSSRMAWAFVCCIPLGWISFYLLLFYLEALSMGDKPIQYLTYRPITLIIIPFTLAIACCLIGIAQDTWRIWRSLPSMPRPWAYSLAIKLVIGGIAVVIAITMYLS